MFRVVVWAGRIVLKKFDYCMAAVSALIGV